MMMLTEIQNITKEDTLLSLANLGSKYVQGNTAILSFYYVLI